VLQGQEPATRFSRSGATWTADPDGDPLLVRDVIAAAVGRWADPATGSFDPARTEELEGLLTRGGEVRPRWVLRLDELSLSATSYANTGAAGTDGPFEETRETRLTMPDNSSLGLVADLALVYDGPALAWENRLKGKLVRAVISLDADREVAQEQADDLLAFSELRLNSVRLDVAGDAFRLVPYLRGAWDSELTGRPTPEEVWQPPEQHLLRAGLGWVAYPGPRLQEVRLGGLAQRDLPRSRNDYGLELGWRMSLPLGPVRATNDLDLRYLVPDGADGPEDLSLRRWTWPTRSVCP